VVGEVEVRVGNPARLGGVAAEPAGQRRRERDPLVHPRAQGVDVERSAAQARHLARVPGDRRALEREDRAVLGAERDRVLSERNRGVHDGGILADTAPRRHRHRDRPLSRSPDLNDARHLEKRCRYAAVAPSGNAPPREDR